MRLIGLAVVLAVSLALAPLAADAQQAGKIPRVGILWLGSRTQVSPLHEAFLRGLRDVGYVEGRNIVVEVRTAEGKVDQLPTLVADLVRQNVDVLVTPSTAAARAAKAVTSSVPIVMANVTAPESLGLVASLARPGGNVTGLSNMSSDLGSKYVELLKQALPNLSRLAVISDPNTAHLYRKGVESAARVLGVRLHVVDVRTIEEIENAFPLAVRSGDGAALLASAGQGSGVFLFPYRQRVAETGLKYRLPTMFGAATWVEAGGLMSYGPDVLDIFRRAAIYVDKILKGTKPADLPVEQPTTFELVINLKTAKALGLTIPQTLLQRADQVIQ